MFSARRALWSSLVLVGIERVTSGLQWEQEGPPERAFLLNS